jgi:hypothetical protein
VVCGVIRRCRLDRSREQELLASVRVARKGRCREGMTARAVRKHGATIAAPAQAYFDV